MAALSSCEQKATTQRSAVQLRVGVALLGVPPLRGCCCARVLRRGAPRRRIIELERRQSLPDNKRKHTICSRSSAMQMAITLRHGSIVWAWHLVHSDHTDPRLVMGLPLGQAVRLTHLYSRSRSSRHRLCALPTSCQCLHTQHAAATSALSSSCSTVSRAPFCRYPQGVLLGSSPQKLTLRLVDVETRSFLAVCPGDVDILAKGVAALQRPCPQVDFDPRVLCEQRKEQERQLRKPPCPKSSFYYSPVVLPCLLLLLPHFGLPWFCIFTTQHWNMQERLDSCWNKLAWLDAIHVHQPDLSADLCCMGGALSVSQHDTPPWKPKSLKATCNDHSFSMHVGPGSTRPAMDSAVAWQIREV